MTAPLYADRAFLDRVVEGRLAQRRPRHFAAPAARQEALQVYLPESVTSRLIWEQARRERAAALKAAASEHAYLAAEAERAVLQAAQGQRMLQGQVAVVRPGEDARKPDALLDNAAGRRPVLIVGGGEEHVEELQEMAAEIRHYGEDLVQRRRRKPVDGQAEWSTMVESVYRNQVRKGMRNTTIATHGFLGRAGVR